jgi:hypothetical protein
MALAYIYVIARRLLGILLGRLRSQHAKDIEIALSSPVERCRQQVRTRRCQVAVGVRRRERLGGLAHKCYPAAGRSKRYQRSPWQRGTPCRRCSNGQGGGEPLVSEWFVPEQRRPCLAPEQGSSTESRQRRDSTRGTSTGDRGIYRAEDVLECR